MALEHTRFTVWGLNPNDEATFLVILALSLPVLLRWSRLWVWFVWPAETALIGLLVGTGSRGGVLALICGGLVGLILKIRLGHGPRGWKPWTAIALAITLGVGAGLTAFPKASRLGSVDIAPDASAGRRLEVWATVTAMLAAAPNGWGFGNAAQAYEQWFEPTDEPVHLLHLLSSHLTWLVEFGWPLRWCYLFFWLGALALLFPWQGSRFSAWGLAVWTAFFVALFYNASGKWWNWPLPSLWLVAAFIWRCRQRVWPGWRLWVGLAFGAAVLDALPFVIFGIHPSSIPVRAWNDGNIVVIGAGKPSVAILSPDKDVLGDFYGHEIRRGWSKASPQSGSVIVVMNPDRAYSRELSECALDSISGADEGTLYKWRLAFTPKFEATLVLINCRAPIDDWMKVFRKVTYYRGDFYGDQNYPSWKDFSRINPNFSVETIPECDAYVAHWWPLLTNSEKK